MTSSGIVIAGAAMCGANAAATLRDDGYRDRVVLIGMSPARRSGVLLSPRPTSAARRT